MKKEIIEQGQLNGPFKGFKNTNTIFQFCDGKRWRQAEHKYHYHYAFRPNAKVIAEENGDFLYVDGMNKTVKVCPA